MWTAATAAQGTNSTQIATTAFVASAIGSLTGMYQPLDGSLTSLSDLAGVGFAVQTSPDTWATRSIAVGSSLSVTDGDGVAGNPTISLNFANANTWTAAQTISTAGGTLLTLISSDAGASMAPNFDLYRNSASPAVNDQIGAVRFRGNDSGLNNTVFASITTTITDPTNGSEDGRLDLWAIVAGTDGIRVKIGGGLMVGAGAADPGADNLNVTGEMRVANLRVVGARDTGWVAMTGTANKATVYDTGTVTLPQLAGRVMALQAALTTHGMIGA